MVLDMALRIFRCQSSLGNLLQTTLWQQYRTSQRFDPVRRDFHFLMNSMGLAVLQNGDTVPSITFHRCSIELQEHATRTIQSVKLENENIILILVSERNIADCLLYLSEDERDRRCRLT
jgi:hypothetical protein